MSGDARFAARAHQDIRRTIPTFAGRRHRELTDRLNLLSKRGYPEPTTGCYSDPPSLPDPADTVRDVIPPRRGEIEAVQTLCNHTISGFQTKKTRSVNFLNTGPKPVILADPIQPRDSFVEFVVVVAVRHRMRIVLASHHDGAVFGSAIANLRAVFVCKSDSMYRNDHALNIDRLIGLSNQGPSI